LRPRLSGIFEFFGGFAPLKKSEAKADLAP
jgi:hypothetical protein